MSRHGLQRGDRIRVCTLGDDGFPLVRYGFVGSVMGDDGPVMVMFDDELNGQRPVDLAHVEKVSITSVELHLAGADLLSDPSLRQGLVNLWSAEAEEAGLEIGALHCMGTGVRDSSEGYALAELNSGGEHYVLRAMVSSRISDTVCVRADRPNRFF